MTSGSFFVRVQSSGREQAMAEAKLGAVFGLPRALQVMYVAIILENDSAEYMDPGVCPQDPVSEEESE